MARPRRKHQVRRLNLELPLSVWQKLENVKRVMEAPSAGEVIRRAVHFYDLLVIECEKGGHLVIRDEKGKERELIFLESALHVKEKQKK